MLLGFRKNCRASTGSEGSTLIPVLGLMMLGLLVISLIAAALSQSLSFTASSGAAVQSQAAAESGVVAAKNLILNGECSGVSTISEPGPPSFSASIWRNVGPTSWVRGCPVSSTQRVRIISTGYAQESSSGLANFGLSSIVESIFDYATKGPSKSGPAIITFGTSSPAVSSFSKYEVKYINSPGNLYVTNGDFSCSNDTRIDGNVIVGQGAATLADNCWVTGTVKAKGTITLNGNSHVGGDVRSNQSVVIDINSNPTTFKVEGFVEASGSVTINGRVQGAVSSKDTVTTGTSSFVGGTIKAGPGTTVIRGAVLGNVIVNGNLTIFSGSSISGSVIVPLISNLKYNKGTIYTGSSASTRLFADKVVKGSIGTTPAPQTPLDVDTSVPPSWIHLTYNYPDWQNAGFDRELILPAGNCTIPKNVGSGTGALNDFWRDLESSSLKTVVDATSCATISGYFNLSLSSDVVFFGKQFSLTDFDLSSADGLSHNFWLIVPDGTSGSAATGPACVNGVNGPISISNLATVHSPVIALAYTPCAITLPGDSSWRGQIIAGSIGTDTQLHTLWFDALGLPSVNIDTGQTGTQVDSPNSMVLSSSRNLNPDGP